MNPTGNPVDPNNPADLATLRQGAFDASQNANNLQTSAPGLLNTLKQNLVGIFAKDNPVMEARNGALSDYLAEGANTRAGMLNLGAVPGATDNRSITLSPTQQDAIVQSRNAAALAPLAGYNQILSGEYGTIGDMLGNAGNIYSAQIQGANNSAKNVMDMYTNAEAEMNANRNYQLQLRQLMQQWALNRPLDLQGILDMLRGGQGGGATPGMSGNGGYPDPSQFYSNPTPHAAPAQNNGGNSFVNGIIPNIAAGAQVVGNAAGSVGNNIQHWLDSLYSGIPTFTK